MNKKPRIKPRLTSFDWMLNNISLAALYMCLSFSVYAFPLLPEQIPRYFDLSRSPIAFYSSKLIWIFPTLSLLFYLLINWVNKRPHLYNYPEEITHRNAIEFYLLACRWVRIVQVIFMGAFAYTTYITIDSILKSESIYDDLLILAGASLISSAIVIQLQRYLKRRQYRLAAKQQSA